MSIKSIKSRTKAHHYSCQQKQKTEQNAGKKRNKMLVSSEKHGRRKKNPPTENRARILGFTVQCSTIKLSGVNRTRGGCEAAGSMHGGPKVAYIYASRNSSFFTCLTYIVHELQQQDQDWLRSRLSFMLLDDASKFSINRFGCLIWDVCPI